MCGGHPLLLLRQVPYLFKCDCNVSVIPDTVKTQRMETFYTKDSDPIKGLHRSYFSCTLPVKLDGFFAFGESYKISWISEECLSYISSASLLVIFNLVANFLQML